MYQYYSFYLGYKIISEMSFSSIRSPTSVPLPICMVDEELFVRTFSPDLIAAWSCLRCPHLGWFKFPEIFLNEHEQSIVQI